MTIRIPLRATVQRLLRGAACAALFFSVASAQAQTTSHRIFTLAGNGVAGFSGDGGLGGAAQINSPRGLAVDGSGNVYIADGANNRIRKIAPNGIVSTIAGGGTSLSDGVNALSAELSQPNGIEVDGNGNIYFSDQMHHKVRRIDVATQLITTIAGTGANGFNGDNQLATSAQLARPAGLAIDGNGNVYIADYDNHRIRRVDAISKQITTVAGTGVAGFNGDAQLATSAQLNAPNRVALDASGNLFIGDISNQRIRRVDSVTKNITTVAGTGVAGFSGDGEAATSANLNYPNQIAVDGNGNLYINDNLNHRIRKVDAVTQKISTVAGTGVAGFNGDGLVADQAQLNYPVDVKVDSSGSLYVADMGNHRIRKVGPLSLTIAMGNVYGTSAVLSVVSNLSATAYWVALPGSDAAPSAMQVKAGQNSLGAMAAVHGSAAVTANVGSTITLTSLSLSSQYKVYMVVSDGSAVSAVETVVMTTTGLPTAPVLTTAAAGNAQITLTFTPSASNGGSVITSYTASCTGAGVTRSAVGTASALVLSNLPNGVSYLCTVYASNANGDGAASDPKLAKPVSPTDLANQLFDYAEAEYPYYFYNPGHTMVQSKTFLTYYYRQYLDGAVLAVSNGRVYVVFPAFGHALLDLGPIMDLMTSMGIAP